MATNTGLAALFDPSYQTGDPELDALFGLTGQPVEDLPPLRYPERGEIAGGEEPKAGRGRGGRGAAPNTIQQAYSYMVERGLPPHVAAGLAGGFMQESGGVAGGKLNKEGGMGLGQWRKERLYGGNGYTGLIPFARSRGTSIQDWRTQIDYALNELEGPERKAFERLLATKTPEEAALIASQFYERPAKEAANNQNRIKWANSLYSGQGTPQEAYTPTQFPNAPEWGAQLNPALVSPVQQLIDEYRAEGIDLRVQSGHRDIEEQRKLYAQGRTAPGKIVTWTAPEKSKHVHGDAVDLVPYVNGKPTWDMPEEFWQQLGQRGTALGLEWGGNWKKSPDRPHFQVSPQLVKNMGQSVTPDLIVSQTPQALRKTQQQQESPYYPVRLSDGQVFDVEKGMGLDEVAAMLQQNSINAKPLRPYVTPDGQEFDVEYDMTDDEVQNMLKGQKLVAPEESNYLGAGKYGAQQAVSGIAQGAGTEIGELGKAAEGASWLGEYGRPVGEFLRGKGEQLHAYGEQLGKESAVEYARPKGLNPLEENILYPAAETAGQMLPYVGAGALSAIPGVGEVVGPAAVAGLTHAGVMGGGEQEAEAAGKKFVPSEYRPYAVGADIANLAGFQLFNKALKVFGQEAILGSREAIKAAVEKGGIEAAKKEVGSRLANIAAQTGWAEAGLIGGEVIEDAINRAYLDKPLLDEGAREQYLETAKQVGPLGLFTGPMAGLGTRYNKQVEVARLEEQAAVEEALQEQDAQRQKIEELATIGVTPEQLQKYGVRNELEGLSDEELLESFKADLAEKEAAKAARLAELPEELRDIPYREAKRYQQMLAEQEAGITDEEAIEPVEEQPAPVESVSAASPVAPEMGAVEVPEADEIPDPTIRGKEPKLPEAVAPEITNPADILGLNNRSGLRRQLQGFDINNVEDHPKIEGILQKTSTAFSAENLANLETKMKEVQSANGIQKPAAPNVGSFEQPEIRQEGQGAPVSSEGVRSSGQEIGAVKIPESQEVETASVVKLQTPAEARESLRTPDQPAFESLSKDTQKLWRDEYKASEGIVGKDAVDELAKSEKLFTKEAKASNPDVGIRPVKVEDYRDIKDTRELVKRYKEKGTDPELLKLMDTINVSPHLGALPVEWVQKGDKPHSDVVDAFNRGATAMVAWGEKTGPKMYIRADAPLREDILVHEAVHGVTEAALQRNSASAKELSDLSKQIGYSLSEEYRMAHGSKGKEASDFWNEVIKDNPGELLAYGLTSPTFREVLSQYGTDGKPFKAYRTEAELNALRKGQEKPARVFTAQAPKELTLWDKFVDAVAKLFGLPTSRKAEFKRQLDEYLNKKATYEQKVKDYNTLRPLQERLDTAFKEALKETSKKGIDFEGTAVKQIKEEAERTTPLVKETEAEGPSETELKEAEKRLKASGLVGAVKDKTFGDKLKGVINDLFKEGRNTSFVAEYVDIREPISKAVQDLPDNVGKKLRSDYIYSAYEQRGNVIQESYRKGFVAMGRDGTIETVADKQLALAEIFKRVGVKNHNLFNNVLVALRVRTIRAQDAETRAQANKMLNMADEMEDFASTLKNPAKRKKFYTAAKNLRTVAERKLESINWDKGRTAFTEQEVKDAETVLAGHPELVNEAENVYALLRKQVDLWENEGMIDKDTADNWRKYPNYFPLYKTEKYDEQIANPSAHLDSYGAMMGKNPDKLPKVHRQEWHEHKVFVEDNLLRHITFFASAAAEHSARKNTAYNLEMVGKAERVKKDSWGDKDLIVKFRENGKDVFYRVDDIPSYYAMQSAMPLMSPLLKRMRQAGNFGRGVMIKNPLFWFRQSIREPIQASLVGRAGFISPFDTLNAVSRIASGSAKGYERLRAKGVIGPVDVIPDPAEFIKAVQDGKGLVAKGMDGINHVHEAMDAATRVVVYEKAKKDALSKGYDEDTADAIGVMKAREIINFAKQGRSKTVRAIRATTPFFGAALNSLDVMARAAFPRKVGHLSKAEAMEARRNFYSTAFMLATFTTAYAAMMSEDEDYLKEPDRVGNWLIPIGGGKFIKIPIPFEAGWFIKELPELAMLLNLGAINKKEAITEGAKGAAANVLPPMPTAYVLQPLMEVAVDHDFFTGSSIEGKDSDVMARDRNSKASKLMTEVVNKMEDMGVNVLGVSANQLEHLARKYLGQLWAVTRVASDAYMNRGKVTPEKEAGEYPLVSGVLTTGTKDRAVNQFYTVAKEASQVNQSLEEAGKKGDAERFNQIVKNPENVKALKGSDEMKKLKEEIGEISTGIKRIENDQSLSSSEMTARIKTLKARQTLLAKRGVEVARKLGMEI